MFQFHQPYPHHICQNKGAVKTGICYNPRCSLACRRNFAWKEATLLTAQLNAYAGAGYQVYFGNLKVRADIPGNLHSQNRKDFLQNLRFLSREHGWDIRIYCLCEIGRDLRLHDHYAMVSNVPISAAVVKHCWEVACWPNATTVHHAPPRKAIEAAVKYMTKNRLKDRTGKSFIRLFAQGTVQVTWGSRPFFLPNKAHLWQALKRGRQP